MTADQMIVLAAPHGFEGGPTSPDTTRGLVSLVFLPRLIRGTTLDRFPGWSVWPDELSGLAGQPPLNLFIRVSPEGGNQRTFVSQPILHDARPTSSAWWKAVFPDPSAVAVTPFVARNPARRTPETAPAIDSYPEATAATLLQTIDDARFAKPGEPLTVGALRELSAGGDKVLDRLPLAQARQFTAPRPGTPGGDDADLDFHQAISLFRRHPELCRRLGLTVELVLDLQAIRTALPADTTRWELEISTDWSSPNRRADREEVAPAILIDDATFRPMPGPDSLIVNGQLPLADDQFIFARGGTTTQLLGLGELGPLDDTDLAPLPPDPSNPGVELLWDGRADDLLRRWDRMEFMEASFTFRPFNADLGGGTPPGGERPDLVLDADDIAAAYRIDIAEDGPLGTSDPLSLFEREAPQGYLADLTQVPPAQRTPPPVDEGWIGTVLATGDATAAPRLPERLFAWLGWSLAAPLLGTRFDAGTGEAVPKPDNTPDPDAPVRFGVNYEVPAKTLPTLRYGTTYRARARVVDIAGNSVARVGEVAPGFSDPLFYGRKDPVRPPTVLRREPPEQPKVPGSSTTTIVLRSQPDQDDATVPPQDRMLFPPEKDPRDWLLVEQPVDRHTADGYQRFVALDARRLDDQVLSDPDTGEAIAGVEDAGGGIAPGPTAPVADYLRDPLVAGIRLAGLPGAADAMVLPFQLPDTADAVELRYIARRLVFTAGEGAPALEQGADPGLHIAVPKACIAQVQLSSSIVEDLVDRLQVTSFDLDAQVAAGANVHASPPTTLDVVHAIPNGRFPPTMQSLVDGDRPALNARTASFLATIGVDMPATASLTLRGSWTDPVDDPSEAGPTRRTTRAVLGTLPVEYQKDGTSFSQPVTYDMPDAFRHELVVQARALARFTDYFVDPHPIDFSGGDDINLGTPLVDSTVSLRPRGGGSPFTRGGDYEVDAATGRLTRNPSGGIDAAAPLTLLFAPGPNHLTTLDGSHPTATVIIPNATIPALPEVTSVQPAYTRRQRRRWGGQFLRTDGRVLRLRLARPWLQTGDGEQLAVVVDSDSLLDLPLTSRFARDPIQAGEGPGNPNVSDFPAATTTAIGVPTTLPGGQPVIVDVAGHTPTFDEEQGDWVVDIVIDAPTYRPAMRLAVARFQPDSIDGAALSPLTFLELTRLGVSREHAVTRGPGWTPQAPTVQVSVSGADHAGRLNAAGDTVFNVVRVTVQEADAQISDPDLRWTSTGTVVELPRSSVGTDASWDGEVALPPAIGPLRLLVEEFEPVVRDDGTGEGAVDALDLVAVETIALPEAVTRA